MHDSEAIFDHAEITMDGTYRIEPGLGFIFKYQTPRIVFWFFAEKAYQAPGSDNYVISTKAIGHREKRATRVFSLARPQFEVIVTNIVEYFRRHGLDTSRSPNDRLVAINVPADPPLSIFISEN